MLSRQELGANFECRVETQALENVVSNHIHIDLQGIIKLKTKYKIRFIHAKTQKTKNEMKLKFQIKFSFIVRPTKVDLSGVKDHTVQGSNILLQCLVSLIYFRFLHHITIISLM